MRIRIDVEVAAKIREAHPDARQLFRDGLRLLVQNPSLGKPLRDPLKGMYSLRLKRYRLIYRLEEDVLFVAAFGHRSTIYDLIDPPE